MGQAVLDAAVGDPVSFTTPTDVTVKVTVRSIESI